jgi:hypothetical protein
LTTAAQQLPSLHGLRPPEARRSIDGTATDFIDQFFHIHQKGSPPWRGAQDLFSVSLVVLVLLFTSVFQLSTFTDTVVRLSLFAALISRMPSR